MGLSKQIKSKWQMLVLTLLVVVCVALSGCGKKEKVYRVGILSGLVFAVDAVDGFKTGMKKLGYIEGKNIIYDLQETDSPS